MTFSFHPEAEREFLAATDYYESCESGLGQDFALEIYSTIQHICAFPKAWPLLEPEIRRSLVHRFPFGVIYAEEKGQVHVLAVMHLHRNPDYWKDRL